MRLKANMIKGKAVYRLLVLVLAVGLVISPFPVIKTAEASTSVTNAWVELSDDTALNSTSTALEYVIHFTTTTALTGGVDTITVTFPDGTTAMAGDEGSGYAFTLPSSIAATYVAVDPDGAATTTVGYTDCYTNPDVGTSRVRLTIPEDIAAGASPYIKFETTANIQSASQDKTTAGNLCHYRVKVETSQDTTAVYSEYFYLGGTAVSDVDHLSGYPTPATVGSVAAYKFEFTVGASGALAAGSGTITVIFPAGTTVPASASKQQVQVDADGEEDSYSLTACDVHPTCHPDSRTVTLTVPQAVTIAEGEESANVYVYFREGFELVNPTASASDAKVKIYTSAEPKYTKATTGYSIAADTATKLEFANKSGAYSDDATMVNMYSSAIYLQLQDQYGNRKAPSNDLTAGLSSTSGTGKYYSAVGSQISSATIYDGTGDPEGSTAGQFSFLYKDSAAGAHTITASVPGYTEASWTVTVAPAVSIYDSNNNLVNTYAPTSTSPVDEADGYHGGDYVQNAVNDALPGETVKLGDGIYELDTRITVAKAITVESASGASSTTLRPTTDDLYGIWENSGSDVFAVGASGTIVHYNGTSWSDPMTSGTTNALYGVWGSSGTDVYAVGASGTILHYSDSSWSELVSGTTNTLYSVWGKDSTNIFAVGASGTILYSTGGETPSWSSLDSGITDTLYGVWGKDSTVFAVGASGTILKSTDSGSNWSLTTSGTNTLYGVWGSSATNVFAVGASGTILHYYTDDGDPSWSDPMTSGTTNTLYGVWGKSASDVFAVGASGTILHYGSSWSSQTSGITDDLRGVWEYSASNAFAVGICGTILHYYTDDGDPSWSDPMTSPTNTVDKAINITATGSATYGVTIDGITFERLRSGNVFTYGIYVDSYADYTTVQNCIFDYIYNRGIRLYPTNTAFTNGTISNNTFSNGGGSSPAGTDAAIDITASASHAISGITISGNTITGQKGKGIYLAGDSTYEVSSVSITSNTITSATSYGIQGHTYTDTITITSNTITGCYQDGIYVKGTAYTIKKNTVTGNLGDGIDVGYTSASHLINYNDIYDNTGYGVNVLLGVSTVDTRYNWWGSATGPTYTAATGASVDVSNPEGTGEDITDRVTYYEWLYKPIADVIADNAAYYTRAVNLSVGWNTLSTPIILDASGDTVDEVVDSAKMTIAYWYDTNDADSDGIYWEQVTTGYELEPCDAIYIKMNATDSVILKYNATDTSTPTKDLYAGWNLIGLANLESKHVDDAVKSVANTPTNLPGYSQVISPSMNSADWTYSSGQSYTNQAMLVGEGYWIYMQNDCTLAGFTITPLQPSLD